MIQEVITKVAMDHLKGIPGPTGPMGMRGDPGMNKDEKEKLLMYIGVISLRAREMISNEEHIRICDMIYSSDKDNRAVAKTLIEEINKGSRGEVFSNQTDG